MLFHFDALRRVSSTTETSSEAAKLELFLQWLMVNGVELRACDIKYCGSGKGFGVFSSDVAPDAILLVVPLDLAITPMRVLQDPLLGPECRAMLDEGGVDDRLLIMLFLIVERLRNNSYWIAVRRKCILICFLIHLEIRFGFPKMTFWS
ncbi:uncharacterized protein LOC142505938 isoform X2 [Primulina tabacum]|uniref:uncharacterized protein LOC142505938 isoform X2 n=1 Tax=Primulina tabacum TaxID=48773 RepID=UPI003F5AA0FD